jgi:hypothetical protein
MIWDKNKYKKKKNECQPLLAYKTHALGHWIKSTKYEKNQKNQFSIN